MSSKTKSWTSLKKRSQAGAWERVYLLIETAFKKLLISIQNFLTAIL
jgi:hypothetical protein